MILVRSLFVILVSQTLWLAQSHAAEPGSAQFKEELSKQEQIYQSKEEQRPEGYVIDRSLLSYIHTLSPEFDRSLAILGSNDRWLDIGAGRGQAVLDYFDPRYDRMHFGGREQPDKKARAVAISIEDRRTSLWHQIAASLGADQLRYLAGKRLRDYSSEELGKFQVITDVIGGLSYAQNLSQFVEKVLEILDLNGSFFTVLQDVHAEDGRNKPHYEGEPFLTEITNAAGSKVKACSWLKAITCVVVTCEFKAKWVPPIEVYHIRKVCNKIAVPALEPVHYKAGTPPERGFQLKK